MAAMSSTSGRPLLKHRRELSKEAAIRLWRDKSKMGWISCSPQW